MGADLFLPPQMPQHPLPHLASLGVAMSLDQVQVDVLTTDDSAQVHRVRSCHNHEQSATQPVRWYRVVQHFWALKSLSAASFAGFSNSGPSLGRPSPLRLTSPRVKVGLTAESACHW